MTFFCFVVISRRTPSGRQTDRVRQHRPSTFAGVQRVFAAGYANEYENENCVNGHGSLHTPAQMLAHTHTHTQTHVTGLCCNIVGASRLSIDITLSSRSSDYNAHMWRMRNAAKPSRPSPVESMLGWGGGWSRVNNLQAVIFHFQFHFDFNSQKSHANSIKLDAHYLIDFLFRSRLSRPVHICKSIYACICIVNKNT